MLGCRLHLCPSSIREPKPVLLGIQSVPVLLPVEFERDKKIIKLDQK